MAYATNSYAIRPQTGIGLNVRLFYPKEDITPNIK
jgi:hypothetical protein